MSAYQAIVAALDAFSGWQKRSFSASGAERVAPLFRRLGHPASVALYETSVRVAWAAINSMEAQAEAKKLLAKVESLPEAHYDQDSASLEYDTLTALNILIYALEVVSGSNAESIKPLCGEIMSMKGACDLVLEFGPSHVRVIDPTNPPPPGPLEQEEIEFQRKLISSLMEHREAPIEFLNEVRRLSEEEARAFDKVLQEYVRLCESPA